MIGNGADVSLSHTGASGSSASPEIWQFSVRMMAFFHIITLGVLVSSVGLAASCLMRFFPVPAFAVMPMPAAPPVQMSSMRFDGAKAEPRRFRIHVYLGFTDYNRDVITIRYLFPNI